MSVNRDMLRRQATLATATSANVSDPFRKGSEVLLPATGDLMIVGDLHGHMENFKAAVAAADLANHPERHVVLQEVIHQLELGEDHSHRVLEETAALKAKYPTQVHVILGNHDLAEWQGREIFKGGLCLNLLFRSGIRNAYGEEDGAKMHAAYKAFIATMPLAVRACGTLLAVHTTPERAHIADVSAAKLAAPLTPADYRQRSWVDHLVWGRDFTPESAEAFAAAVQAEVFIVGHTPCKRGYRVPNPRHIIIDSKDRYGVYVHLDLAKRYTQAEVVQGIRPLQAGVKIGPEAVHAT